MVMGAVPVAIASISRLGNTVRVHTASAHGLVQGDTVRIAGTGLYDDDHYPVYYEASNQFAVIVRPDNTQLGTVLGGTIQKITDLYTYAIVSDKNRWLALAPGDNDITVTWTPFPGTVNMSVSFDDHYG